MPRTSKGQLVTFALERDQDTNLSGWVYTSLRVGDTVAKLAARRGHPDQAKAIAKRNGIRSTRTVLLHKPKKKNDKTRLLVPRPLRTPYSFHVLAGDTPPKPTGGYAKLSIVDRPERVGLTDFDGYDPITMEVPVRFLASDPTDGGGVESDIALLERMAGRGDFDGAGVGPPPIVRVSTTDNNGDVVPLIPRNYQWTKGNTNGPLWRVAGIDWDTSAQGCRRNPSGNRIVQVATVTLQQHTAITTAKRLSVRKKPKG